jgi:hypothetical protein
VGGQGGVGGAVAEALMGGFQGAGVVATGSTVRVRLLWGSGSVGPAERLHRLARLWLDHFRLRRTLNKKTRAEADAALPHWSARTSRERELIWLLEPSPALG